MAKSHFYVSASKFKNAIGKKQKRQFVEWKEMDVSLFPKYMSTLQGHIRAHLN